MAATIVMPATRSVVLRIVTLQTRLLPKRQRNPTIRGLSSTVSFIAFLLIGEHIFKAGIQFVVLRKLHLNTCKQHFV